MLSSLLFIEAKSNDTQVGASSSLTSNVPSASNLAGFTIQVNTAKGDDDEGNSPALNEDEEEEEKNEEEAEETEEGLSTVDGDVDESIFASAGLKYNPAVGMILFLSV